MARVHSSNVRGDPLYGTSLAAQGRRREDAVKLTVSIEKRAVDSRWECSVWLNNEPMCTATDSEFARAFKRGVEAFRAKLRDQMDYTADIRNLAGGLLKGVIE